MNSLQHQRLLLALLEAHTPADALERAHHQAIASFVRREPACFARTTYTPGHITGSAFIVDPERRLVLLHHHRKLDRWLQMGGHDEGEHDAAATALREAREESGLSALRFASEPPRILDVDVHEIPARKDEPAHQHLDVRFLFFADSTQPFSIDAAESKAMAWIPLSEAAAKMGEVGAARVVKKIEALLGPA